MSVKNSLFIIIVGCGRLGSYLANKLSNNGHSVVAIDVNESAFDSLSSEFSGFKIEGDATEFAILKQAKIDKADIVIGATHNDNINVMIAQVAKKVFNVPRVMVRIFEPKRAELCDILGIDSVCPTAMAGHLIVQSIEEKKSVTEKGNQRWIR